MPALYFTRDSVREEFSDEVKKRGVRVKEIYEDIFYAESGERLYWVSDFWPNVASLDFLSISDAAKKLRALSRRWIYAGGVAFRRGQLIAEALKSRKAKALDFPAAEDNPPGPAFTLANEKSLFYSMAPLKRNFAGGKIVFTEDRKGPPSRAYLKLWEVITLTGIKLSAADNVLDLGATPGGWSYVAASLGARVTMLDRARLIGATFRVAFMISAAQRGVLSHTHFRNQGRKLVLVFDKRVADLAADRVINRYKQLVRLMGRSGTIAKP